MKTLYLKTTMKLLRLLPVLIFFMLALSYNARSQFASPNPVCYGQPINLFCSLSGCDVPGATYSWTNVTGSWVFSGTASIYQTPVLYPPGSALIGSGQAETFPGSGICNGQGYAEDRFFLQVQFAPPPGGFSGGTVKVNLLPGVNVTGVPTHILCFGLSTGSINMTPSGGRPPYTYLWSNGSTVQDPSGLPAGTYTVLVTDFAGCFNDIGSWTITQPDELMLSGGITPVLCSGASTGAIDLTVAGGTLAYGYAWSNGAITEDVSGLTAGTYSVTVTDAHGCQKTGSYIVTSFNPLVLTGLASPALCNGGNTGSIDISVSGGNTPYGYAWNNGEITEDVSGLTAGVYTVVVTDGNGCEITNTWQVTEPSALTLEGTASGVLCKGGNTGSVNITVTGGTTAYGYSWNTGAVTEDISGLTAGVYTVVVTDGNGCQITNSYTVTEPLADLAATAAVTDVNCNGNHNGSLDLTVTGGTMPYGYLWNTLATTEDLSGLFPGDYSVVVTDANGCTTTGSWTITEPSDITWVGSTTDVSCFGGSDGHIEGGASGGTPPYTYLWSNGATTQNISGLTAGTYTVTPTDAVGCYTFTSRVIGQPTLLVVEEIAVITNVLCNGGNNGAIDITVNGGTAPYGYLWSNGATTQDISGLTAGGYSVAVTDAMGCMKYGYWFVTEPSLLVLSGTPSPVLCNGGNSGSIDLSVAGGTTAYSYLWNNTATTQDISGLIAGDYTVVVTDGNGCQKTTSFTVTEPSALTLTGSATAALCNLGNTGSIDITVTGGTTAYGYAWSNGAITEDISGLTAGVYTVVVTDGNGCQISNSYTVTEPTALDLTGTPTPVLCYGDNNGSVDITVTGGTMPYGYLWNNGATSEDITTLMAGVYDVVVTDANGCSISNSWIVTEPSALSLTGTSTPALCNGGNTGSIDITVGGGTLAYGYLWNNGAVTEDISGLTSGTYTVVVTDGNGCQITGTYFVSEPALPLTVVATATNVDCNGNHNGAIDVTVTGGTFPYGYLWNNMETTEDLTGLFPGDYSIVVTDANGCTTTGSWNISEPSDISWYGSITDVSCFGGSDGHIEGGAFGGTPPYTYLWSNGATTQDISGLTSGWYTVTPTDAVGCYTFTSRFIGQPTDLVIDPIAIITNVSCNGGANGTIDITVTGGTMPYGYLWNNGATSEDISGLSAGTYIVTVTDAHNCVKTGEWTVTEPLLLAVTGIPSAVLCNGGNTGSINITVTGGTTAYGYAWSNGAITEDISGLTAGTYTVVVTDALGCTATNNFTVTEPTALSLTGTPSPVLCNGGNTGSIDITVTGGTTAYSYSWSTGAGTEDITGLTAGCYTVTVMDANNCMITGSWCVTEPVVLAVTGTASPVLCNGGNTGSVDITVTGGTMPYGYLWNNGATSEDITGLTAGMYSVVVTDANACVTSSYWIVTEPTALSLTGTSLPALCNGGNTGSIDITVGGGTLAYGYLWNNGAVTEDISGLTSGTYTVVVTDGNGCQITGTYFVSEPALPLAVTAVVSNVDCNGNHNGAIDVTVTGGTSPYGYLWNNLETTEDLTGLYSGDYTIVVTDANGCTTTGSWNISEPSDITWVGSTTDVSCFGGSDGHIEGGASGGTPPYTYLWSNGATTQDISGLTSGWYTVTPTDAVGCYTFTSRFIGQPTELLIDPVAVITNVSCNGGANGTIDITVTGGTMPYGYLWNNGATSEDISGLSAGTYTVVVTDAQGCQKTGEWTVTEPLLLEVTGIPSAVLCNGGNTGSINITVTGGTTAYGYAWSNGAITEDISGLTAGTYTVVVTDALGCTATNNFTVTEPTALSLTGTPSPVLCNGGNTGSIDITVTGGTTAYSYSWSTGAGTEDITGLTAGCYTVTVMDANNCMITGSWCVTEPVVLAVTGTASPVLCNGGNTGSVDITVTGGTMPYGYLWNNGATSEDITGLTAGMYSVVVTDANACVTSSYWIVTEPTALSLTGTSLPALCNGGNTGSIDITVGGGTLAYGYLWNNGASSEDISGLTSGTYTVVVTDGNGCQITGTYFVSEPALPLSVTAIETEIDCNNNHNGSLDVTVTGGTSPYSYMWNTLETTEDISGLYPGAYTIAVTDANGCSTTGSWMITEPSDITWVGSTTDVSCFGGSDGHIEGGASGGTPPYTYLWSNGATTQDISGLTSGWYTVTPTDSHGCYTFTSRFIGQPTELIIDQLAIITNVSCNGGADGAIDITVTGGTMPYGYLWNNGATSEDISGLTAGTYNVTVTDAHNCVKTGEWTVTEPSALSLTGTPSPALCNGGNTGSIDITVTGGTLAYNYSWNNGATSEDISGLTAGIYTVVVTDGLGCTITNSWQVTEPTALTLTGTPSAVLCNGGSTGSIDITVGGGTTVYGYAWNNGAITEDISGLTAGVYTVVVTDANGCQITNSWQVTEPTALSLTADVTNVLCNGGNNGAINITVTGGTTAYSYAWSTGAGTEDISGLTAGCYTVTVMDANNCMITGSWCITQPDALVITNAIIRDVTCNGADNGALFVTVSGGVEPYDYLWSNGITTEDLPCCITAGCYTVTVTDANNCQTTGSWCITEPPAITLTGTPTPVLCYGDANGSVDITVTGGTPDYTYEWSNAETTEDISGLIAGVYAVTITDGNGCQAFGSWEVTSPALLTVTGVPADVLCNGGSDGSINITVAGGTVPYGYLWSNGATTEDISGLTAGTYSVVVTDHNLCSTTGMWTVNEPSALSLEASITTVTCYTGSDGAIDLTVTGGTTAYGYVWSNGAITEDISGLTAGVYTVTVTDAHACVATASYQVIEPPMWSIDLGGPSPVCCNTTEEFTYTANAVGVPTGCLVDYEWVVVGGTITSGWNSNQITVKWNCCFQGTVTVTATKCDGCFLTESMTVVVNQAPAPEITGPVSVVSNGTDEYCVLPAIPGHLYSWTVLNGSYTTIPGSNCITVTWDSYPACGCAMIIVCETDPLTGCTGCDTLYITMLPNPLGISISGTVSYKNGLPNTPLNGVTIKLKDVATNVTIATTVSGPNMNPPLYTGDPGYYAFTDVPAGNYKLEASFNGTWGGNNATDALLIQLEAANPGTVLSGLFHTVADVNASLTVTALDALYVKLRTVGSINSYPAGDWKFEMPTVSVMPAVVDFAGLCTGDVNGSYIPTGLKAVSFLSVIDNETMTVPVEETFAYEIRSNMVAQLGAMTLFMGYDKDRFEVIDVTATSNDEMKYVIEDGNVAIAWADTKPMSVRNNDQLFTLTVKAKAPLAEATSIFNVNTGSEFASPTGIRYDNFDLKMAKVITAGGSKEFSMFNYPNPFNANTKIQYTIPEAGKVTLVITDMFGKTVRTLVDAVQEAGTYTIAVNAADLGLSSGAYLYRIDAVGTTDTYVKVNKMIFAR